MKNLENNQSSKHRIIIYLSVIASILCIPLIAMLFTSEVKWTAFDFIVAAILLGATASGIEWVIRTVKKPTMRNLLFAIILLLLFLLWAELAVGIFGSPIAGS
ncbi:hypothetical protein [Pedobacter sp. MW01-1-1]|uniref:hypothetical protein n=1 Tax=Pedobacter sp. MW01-1-1 TaxID=3383027 RepID=UPI003FF08115